MTRAVVIGAGPAGLMAAEVLAEAGVAVTVCDAMPSFGRKFLMAGKSGLNLTKAESFERMLPQFGAASKHIEPILKAFDAGAVQEWAEGLGQDLFTGPTGRVFPTAMKASPLLRAWLQRLDALGVERHTRMRWVGWDGNRLVFETTEGRFLLDTDTTILALGGASWSRLGSDGAWESILAGQNVKTAPFGPSNAAISVKWSHHMEKFFGVPVKSVKWSAGGIISRGEAVLSERGLEGGGVYTLTPSLRDNAPLFVDLVPDRAAEVLQRQLDKSPPKQRLAHWMKNTLQLSPVKISLFNEMTAGNAPQRKDWVPTVKNLPIRYQGLRPTDEAISTSGGVRFDDLTDDLMLKARPGVFCAGEMLDWEAPTGGYLLTGCLATGRCAAFGALRYLEDAV